MSDTSSQEPVSEIIEELNLPIQNSANSSWQPTQGQETSALLNQLSISQESKNALVDSAVEVLSKCIDPISPTGTNTGLVIGYVQSGKTKSFTTVTTLARDNKYQIVIVITGTSKPLFEQSSNRLERDLRLGLRDDRKWLNLRNAQLSDLSNIVGKLADWRDPTVPFSTSRTVLITVMKNVIRLRNLVELLGKLNKDFGLSDVPTLIIDDEADQAGLNTKVRQDNESSTYRRLLDLRAAIPRHSFLQYTATPQAPLLINLIDQLSPRFAYVLAPGPQYTGGKVFFLDQPNLVQTIPDDEIPSKDNLVLDPPDSLKYAMRLFFLGVAAGIYDDPDKSGKHNRSMLVHPSQKTVGHHQYFEWVKNTSEQWKNILDPAKPSPDLQDLLGDFEIASKELQTTVTNLPSFSELTPLLWRAVRGTLIKEVNTRSGKTPEINWRDSYSWILVGGQAMDRGFTVEGLTVTYMPRGIGVGNADTVQQRARFFGYKGDYLGYCRIFLENEARDIYRKYVEHEEDVRDRILDFNQTGRPLTEWKRAFFLDTTLKPTRDNVLSLDYMLVRDSISDEWYWPKVPHATQKAVEDNRKTIAEFIQQIRLLPEPNMHPNRSKYARHEVDYNVPLDLALKELLVPLKLTEPVDSTKHTGFLLQIEKYKEQHPTEECVVYGMSKEGPIWTERERTTDDNGQLTGRSIFQGEQPDQNNAQFKKGEVYVGDRKTRQVDKLTIQIHRLTIKNVNSEPTIYDVPFITVWVPKKMAKGWLVQKPNH